MAYTLEPIEDTAPRYTLEPVADDAPEERDDVLSFRSARPKSVWDRIKEVFPDNAAEEKARAQNALVYSEMLGIRPSQAYEFHDEISAQYRSKTAGQKIVTQKKGMAGAAKAGAESSIAGMLFNQKAPQPFESVSQAETWLAGMTEMGLDLPFFMAGYGIGGGTPISGMAGAFGFTAGLRQVLVDRYTKGEVKNATDLIERIGNAARETVKGEIVGGFTGGAKMMAPVAFGKLAPGLDAPASWTMMNEIATMTAAGKMIEGQLPTAKDFMDTAAVLLTMHVGTRGYESGKARLAEVRDKLKTSYVESGAHPKTILDEIAQAREIDPREDIVETIERVNQELKAQNPDPVAQKAEGTGKEPPKGEIVEPGASSQASEPSPRPEPRPTGETSIKNAVVDSERETRGLPAIETPVSERPKDWRERVEAKVDSGDVRPEELARKINNARDNGEKIPGELTTDEVNHALLYEKKRLQNEYASIEEAIEKGETPELLARRDTLERRLDENEYATKAIGTEQGRALQSRQDAMAEDYSLPAMIHRARNEGVTITPKVRGELKTLSKKIEKAQREVDGVNDTAVAENLTKTIKRIQNEESLAARKEKRSAKAEQLDVEFEKAAQAFAKSVSGIYSNPMFNPEAYKALIDLTRNRIQRGILKAEDIVDSIHTALVNAGLEVSKRDIRDAISRYGQTVEMSKDDIDVALREAKRQMSLLSALEDAQKGELPQRSGLQRDPVSDRVRELQREVQQAIRESGIETAQSKEAQWKTALDRVKKRLTNSISDVTAEIETGKRDPKRQGIEYDAEAKALNDHLKTLRALRDALEEEPATLAPEKPGEMPQPKSRKLTPEQRISAALKAAEKSAGRYAEMVEKGDVAPKAKGEGPLETPELERARAIRDEWKEIVTEMRDAAKEKKSPEEIALKAYKTRLENQITDLNRRLKEGDFTDKPKRRKVDLDAETLKRRFELDSLKREYAKKVVNYRLSERGLPTIVKDSVFEAMNLVRAIKSSFDISAPGRQGFFALISHPIMGFKNIPEMFRALGGEESAYRIEQSIRSRENYKLYEEGGLSLTETMKAGTNVEEIYRSRWAEAIPGIPASNRAFTSYLNLIRADLFDTMHKSAFGDRKATTEELKAIADYVNTATGRGAYRGYEQSLQGLGTFFWAPKLVLSRFQMLLGKGLMPGGGRTAATRKAVAKEYARILTGLATIYAVSDILGGETEDDPRSSDFGKIKVGNTRIDVLAGVSQSAVFLSRIATGETKSVKTGAIKPIRGENVPYGGTDTWDVISNFMRTKLTPVLGFSVNLLQGKNIVGEKVDLYDIPAETVVPLSMMDIYDAMEEEGVPAGTALGVLGLFGIGIQTHEQKGARQ